MKNTASQDDINKAFRQKSRLIHPDKVKQSLIALKASATPNWGSPKDKQRPIGSLKGDIVDNDIRNAVRKASERFARLGIVASILKGPGRERYDHFLSNGFPKWKGTGYYYARFRPGLLTVLFGLFVIFGGLVHYIAIYISWNRQRTFVEHYIKMARQAAWGDHSSINGIPGLDSSPGAPALKPEETGISLNRRQKRLQDKENRKEKDKKNVRSNRNVTGNPISEAENQLGSQGLRKRVQAENGKVLIVDSVGKVFLEAENEDGEREEYLLDPNEISRPTISRTLMVRLPLWIISVVSKGLLAKWRSSRVNAKKETRDGE